MFPHPPAPEGTGGGPPLPSRVPRAFPPAGGCSPSPAGDRERGDGGVVPFPPPKRGGGLWRRHPPPHRPPPPPSRPSRTVRRGRPEPARRLHDVCRVRPPCCVYSAKLEPLVKLDEISRRSPPLRRENSRQAASRSMRALCRLIWTRKCPPCNSSHTKNGGGHGRPWSRKGRRPGLRDTRRAEAAK